MYDVVGKRNLWYAISALLTIPGLVFILIGGLRPSIDFTGGTEWEVRYADEPTVESMTDALAEFGYEENVLVVALDDGFLRIRTEPIDLIPAETPIPSPSDSPAGSASADPSPSASADASGEPSPSGSREASPTESAGADASGSPAPSASATPAPIASGTEFATLHA